MKKVYKLRWQLATDMAGPAVVISSAPTPIIFEREKLFGSRKKAEEIAGKLEHFAEGLGIRTMLRTDITEMELDD